MEHLIQNLVQDLPLLVLLIIIALALAVLAKGADLLVEEAVALSRSWGVPTVIIGATIVSLGTTLPEAAVSVLAAVQGNPALALGNAVGSIITDCGLILGLCATLRPLPLERSVVNRQGWIQVGAGCLLVLFAFPWGAPSQALTMGGRLPQWGGFVLVALLVVYLWASVRSARQEKTVVEEAEDIPANTGMRTFLLLGAGIALVLLGSQILIPTVEVTALRLGVPQAVIAATLVAFGTSLPELVTCLNAVRRGHGELAVGNVIGADILNVLFVAGLSASVTTGGLVADERFFKILFPGMLALLVVFRIGIAFQKDHLGRIFGVVLLLIYLLVTTISYLF